jgi:hypothetical protein
MAVLLATRDDGGFSRARAARARTAFAAAEPAIVAADADAIFACWRCRQIFRFHMLYFAAFAIACFTPSAAMMSRYGAAA